MLLGGHMTDPPATIKYSSVVLRDSVCIAFLLAALNDIYILACDIGNAYLNASPREKVYTTAGPEFGQEFIGRNVLIPFMDSSQVEPHGGPTLPTRFNTLAMSLVWQILMYGIVRPRKLMVSSTTSMCWFMWTIC
jgi:hypothetical protein